uniref:NADH-ubiquinone oxidoreductase chain 2 n=1 Tax=Noterus clavicornis BMNH1425090 TaxID=2558029 RepID=A0A191ZRU1_9COLE|nr:NADH dehydrogenase subunit 2 [Noterus clavicornis BMNH1425090]UPX88473.1 NADH dehydrogenase subunit 2 [Noterus clavicornis]
MNFNYKIMFFFMMMFGTMISISSNNWMSMWMGLEMNLISFISIIKQNNNPMNSESSMKYFLIQAFSSSLFLMSIMLSLNNLNMIHKMNIMNEMINLICLSSLIMKLGMAPLHFWFPEIIEGLSWISTLILMTWQKIAPFMLISYFIKINMILLMLIILSSMLGSIGGLNQTSMRKILVFSSINHMSWMMSSFLINNLMWMIYFLIYSLINMSIIMIMHFNKIFFIKQLFFMFNQKLLMKMYFFINLLSLGGLPPFLGFLSKWLIVQNMSNKYIMLNLIMILLNLITLFFYIRIMINSMIFNNNKIMLINNLNKNNWSIISLSFFSINLLVIIPLQFNLI